MGSLIVCSSCGQHVRAAEEVCPHCTAGMRTTTGTVAKTASAMLLGLAMTGCPGSDDDNASSDTMDVQPLYGEPDPTTSGAPDPEESSSTTTGEPEDESSSSSGSSSTGNVGESEYGVAASD